MIGGLAPNLDGDLGDTPASWAALPPAPAPGCPAAAGAAAGALAVPPAGPPGRAEAGEDVGERGAPVGADPGLRWRGQDTVGEPPWAGARGAPRRLPAAAAAAPKRCAPLGESAVGDCGGRQGCQ